MCDDRTGPYTHISKTHAHPHGREHSPGAALPLDGGVEMVLPRGGERQGLVGVPPVPGDAGGCCW